MTEYKLLLVPADLIVQSEAERQFGKASVTQPGSFEIAGDMTADKVIRMPRALCNRIEDTDPDPEVARIQRNMDLFCGLPDDPFA
jgi:hypothetical protein